MYIHMIFFWSTYKCVYPCVYIYVCICIYIYVCVYRCVRIYTYMCVREGAVGEPFVPSFGRYSGFQKSGILIQTAQKEDAYN